MDAREKHILRVRFHRFMLMLLSMNDAKATIRSEKILGEWVYRYRLQTTDGDRVDFLVDRTALCTHKDPFSIARLAAANMRRQLGLAPT